jgi:hypothetical protein
MHGNNQVLIYHYEIHIKVTTYIQRVQQILTTKMQWHLDISSWHIVDCVTQLFISSSKPVSKIFDYGNKLHIQLGQKVEGKQ